MLTTGFWLSPSIQQFFVPRARRPNYNLENILIFFLIPAHQQFLYSLDGSLSIFGSCYLFGNAACTLLITSHMEEGQIFKHCKGYSEKFVGSCGVDLFRLFTSFNHTFVKVEKIGVVNIRQYKLYRINVYGRIPEIIEEERSVSTVLAEIQPEAQSILDEILDQ